MPELFLRLLPVLLFLLALSADLRAQVQLFVTNTNDAGPGSLRQAIADAALLDNPVITFPELTGSIVLTGGQLGIAHAVTIEGPGADLLSIDGNFVSRVFAIASNAGRVVVSHLSIVHGGGVGGSDHAGGAIHVEQGARLALADCVVSSNRSGEAFSNLPSHRWQWSGGGICNAGELHLIRCSLHHNSAGSEPGFWSHGGDGGGIYNTGRLLMEACTVAGNQGGRGGNGGGYCINPSGNGGSGGGVYNVGWAFLAGCTFHRNLAGAGGDGCGADGGAPGEEGGHGGAGGSGGGIYSEGELIVSNCTFVANSTGRGGDGGRGGLGYFIFDGGPGGTGGESGDGGAICDRGYLQLAGATLVDNTAVPGGRGGEGGPSSSAPGLPGPAGAEGAPGNGGGIHVGGSSPQISHTIVARNSAAGSGADVAGAIISLGDNLVQRALGMSGLGPADTAEVDPLLGSLEDHQGPTRTVAPLPDSPALDRATLPSDATTDQRGLRRPAGSAADIGAVELHPSEDTPNYTNTFSFETIAGRSSRHVHDGTGGGAALLEPSAIAADRDGNLFFAEAGSHVIRRLTPAGEVQTIAGAAGRAGRTDGVHFTARFRSPRGIAVNAAGDEVYVADSGNHVIRRLMRGSGQEWIVTTLAGAAGIEGFADGSARGARFSDPRGLALDLAGRLYVADAGNHLVRRLIPSEEGWIATTFAGVPGSPGLRNGSASQAGFRHPAGLAYDFNNGHLYVADHDNHAIRLIQPDGGTTTIAGSPASQPGSASGPGPDATFHAPSGLAVDPSGHVYVADSRNHLIRQLTFQGSAPTSSADWNVITFAGAAGMRGFANGNSAARFDTPTSVACDAAGRIVVADSGNNLIRRINSVGTVSKLAGALDPGAGYIDDNGALARFGAPAGIALGLTGTILVADTANHSLRQVTTNGAVTTLAGAAVPGFADGIGTDALFRSPHDVLIEPDGNLLVADTGNHILRRASPEGIVTTVAGAPGVPGWADGTPEVARFQSPRGLAAGPIGVIFVADTGNHTIRMLSLQGAAGDIRTIAGATGQPGTNDGTGAQARFDAPWGLAFDAGRGVLYVADHRNNSIRMLSPEGTNWIVSTVAGNNTLYGAGRIDGPASEARFNRPASLALDRSGALYVSDRGNHAIRRLTRTGSSWKVNTVAGIPPEAGSHNAAGDESMFDHPSGLAVDAQGTLWVADTDNRTVRRGAQQRSSLQLWQEARFGLFASDSLVAGPQADPDDDGIPNLAEYALGTDPNSPSADAWPSGSVQPIGDIPYLTLTFPRAIDAIDVSCLVEIADSIEAGAWRPGSLYSATATIHQHTTEVSRQTNGAIEIIVVRDRLPATEVTNRFMRLVVFMAAP